MKKLKKTSDEELLNLYQSNSEENLLNILLQRHMPQIRQNVRSLVCNKEDVEDLCQDIYCRILIKLRQGYYSNGHIQAWGSTASYKTTFTAFTARKSMNSLPRNLRI